MIYNKRCLGLLFLLLVAFSCAQPGEADEVRILFIGNSYTYYNSTPEVLKALIQEKFPEQIVETKLISGGGMTLADHWQNESTKEAIRTGQWDYVILQEQSKLGMGVMIDNNAFFGPTDQFFEHARKFDAEITAAEAETVFLMTWSGRDRPREQAILTHAYTAIAKELEAMVVPVGLAWDRVRTNPTINLYADDGGHPSPIGSYLASVTLYATLMADDPRGLSGTISGNRLSNTGEPSPDKALLIDLPREQAQVLQEASWEVVEAMLTSSDYLNVEKPEPSYTVPVLAKGEAIELENIIGKWYGTSTYGSDYHGQIMEINDVDGEPHVRLSFYSPHGQDQMRIDDAVIEDNQLVLTVYDDLRARNATVTIALSGGEMEGILESSGNFKMYKHLSFSKGSRHNEIDLSALESIAESFTSSSEKEGHVKASLKYYEQYSQLIGATYQPEEFYLNAVGYNFLMDGRVDDALNAFELATVYYPKSVNTYERYAEALIEAGRKEEALIVYTRAYDLAKETGYANLGYIEEQLNKLKGNISLDVEEAAPPPPPPSH